MAVDPHGSVVAAQSAASISDATDRAVFLLVLGWSSGHVPLPNVATRRTELRCRRRENVTSHAEQRDSAPRASMANSCSPTSPPSKSTLWSTPTARVLLTGIHFRRRATASSERSADGAHNGPGPRAADRRPRGLSRQCTRGRESAGSSLAVRRRARSRLRRIRDLDREIRPTTPASNHPTDGG